MVERSMTNLYLANIFTIIASIPTLVVLKNLPSGVYRLYPSIWAAAEILNIKENQKLSQVYNYDIKENQKLCKVFNYGFHQGSERYLGSF